MIQDEYQEEGNGDEYLDNLDYESYFEGKEENDEEYEGDGAEVRKESRVTSVAETDAQEEKRYDKAVNESSFQEQKAISDEDDDDLMKKHSGRMEEGITQEEEMTIDPPSLRSLDDDYYEKSKEEEQKIDTHSIPCHVNDHLSGISQGNNSLLTREQEQEDENCNVKSIKCKEKEKMKKEHSINTSSTVKHNSMTHTLFNSSGISYDAFMRLHGKENHKQQCTQTTEREEESTQTDLFVKLNSWTQHPACHSTTIVGERFESSCDDSHQGNRRRQTALLTSTFHPTDPFQLLEFVRQSERMLRLLLKKNTSPESIERASSSSSIRTKSARRLLKLPAGSEKFCSQLYKLMTPSVIKRCPVSYISIHGSRLISVHDQSVLEDHAEETFLCIWHLSDSNGIAEEILHMRGSVTCALLINESERNENLGEERVIAGTKTGNLVVWDLKGDNSHYSGADDENLGTNVHFHDPSFSTSCIATLDVHKENVVSIENMSSSKRQNVRDMSSERTKSSSSYLPRICSMDSQGTIGCWIVDYVISGDTTMSSTASSVTSEGMFPGSKSKLILEAVIRMPSLLINCLRLRHQNPAYQTSNHDGEVTQDEPNGQPSLEYKIPSFAVIKSSFDAVSNEPTLLVGSGSGMIVEVSQFVKSQQESHSLNGVMTYAQLKGLQPSENEEEVDRDTSTYWESLVTSGVTALDINPQHPNLFVASFEDGSVSLFRKESLRNNSGVKVRSPLMTWDAVDTQVSQLSSVQWLPSCPSIFVAFSATTSSPFLVFWDLHKFPFNPIFKYQLTK